MTLVTDEAPYTRDDLDAMPDDGHRYELIDGMLLVTPSPRFAHQLMVTNLFRVLDHSLPEGLVLLTSPFDVVLAEDTVVIPDLLVAPRDAFTDKDLPAAPLLAIEVLSPSTRGIDLTLKKRRYERSGTAAYWVVDPETRTLTAWAMRGAEFELAGEVGPGETLHLDVPFPVDLSPGDWEI